MEHFIDKLKKMITAKAVISAASLGLFLPFAKLIYWVFDTAYLSGFGINPDVYSRPVFSSDFISVWLFAEAIGTMLIGWLLFSIVIFIVLFNINFGSLEKPKINIEILKEDTPWDEFIKRFSYAFSRSVGWPFFIFTSGLLLLLFLTVIISKSSEKGLNLANEQMQLYTTTGKCADKFNSKNVGCFHIEGIEGTNHFVIANLETHLLYLSREEDASVNRPENSLKKYSTILHIYEKEEDKQYTIKRDYAPSEIKE